MNRAILFLEIIKASNNFVRQFLSGEFNAFYLNIYDHMLSEKGEIREELFTEDSLHMNRKGYILWKKLFLANEKEIFYNPRFDQPEKGVGALPETGNHMQGPPDFGFE